MLYGELHAHSGFSFLDGASDPEELAAEGAGFAEFGRSRLERWIDSLDGEGLARLGRPPLRLILGGRR